MPIQKVGSQEIANTGVTASTYGGADQATVITVDATGRVTYAANVVTTSDSKPDILMLAGM